MSRIGEMVAVLDFYPELVPVGIPFRRIAEECCKRIPVRGCEDGRTPAEVLELAAEATIAAIADQRMRGPSAANYLVATFKAIADRGVREVPHGLSRVGLASEAAEMQRLEAATLKARQEAAQRPLPDPALPARALATMKPRPAEDGWLATGPKARALPPRRRDIDVERCEPLADLIPADAVRESRDIVRENEQIAADRKVGGS
jgi:hypothetical protein